MIRRLTRAPNPPDKAWLVIEKGAAKRFTGIPHESPSSLLLKPFFNMEIQYHFRREDFHPAPSVEAVLLHLKKKAPPDVEPCDRRLYIRFIRESAGGAGIAKLLTKKQISTALKAGAFPCDITSGTMLYVQWLCLFRCYLSFIAH